MADAAGEGARGIMLDFARLTGLDPGGAKPVRYLWTDAFAVCNYLGLFREFRDRRFLDLGLRLVDQVHHTLGRHRGDDPRKGWISGLGEGEGEVHPTIGGLRIGKKLPERRRDESASERLEWDQDGQYFHYLTKWMHALSQTGRATGDPRFLRWAMELAKTAHARFTSTPRSGGRKRMYWKMSIDLSYPLVTSIGQHDPLDGLVTYCGLRLAARQTPGPSPMPDLGAEIAEMAGICRGMELATDDPLGTGGLLADALRIARIMARGGPGLAGASGAGPDLPALLGDVISAALFGLDAFADSGCQDLPADFRLAFRELGLSIGLSAVGDLIRILEGATDGSLRVQAEALLPFVPLGEAITRFWSDGKAQGSGSWREHREINMVMLATGIAPGGFLGT
ncbi:MAG: hypothetical protein LUQ67_01785 [Methanomicrobiales archaeon]|nr:hypothetical protein [Methanomicrobiales archaeon]